MIDTLLQFDDPYDILLTMENCHSVNYSSVIIATDIIHEALHFMINNYKNAKVKIIRMQLPGADTYRKYDLQDISIFN